MPVLLAMTDDPISDYWVVREELRMYNAEYCQRPHIVALNKMDLEDAAQLEEELTSGVRAKAQQLKVRCPNDVGKYSYQPACIY